MEAVLAGMEDYFASSSAEGGCQPAAAPSSQLLSSACASAAAAARFQQCLLDSRLGAFAFIQGPLTRTLPAGPNARPPWRA